MQNSIIDPQVFYWINVLESIKHVTTFSGVLFAIGFVLLVIGWIYNAVEVERGGYESNLLYMKTCKKWAIVTGAIDLILITASILIPGRTTSIEMLVAKTVTFDNVNWTVQQVKEVVDYIVQAIKGI